MYNLTRKFNKLICYPNNYFTSSIYGANVEPTKKIKPLDSLSICVHMRCANEIILILYKSLQIQNKKIAMGKLCALLQKQKKQNENEINLYILWCPKIICSVWNQFSIII